MSDTSHTSLDCHPHLINPATSNRIPPLQWPRCNRSPSPPRHLTTIRPTDAVRVNAPSLTSPLLSIEVCSEKRSPIAFYQPTFSSATNPTSRSSGQSFTCTALRAASDGFRERISYVPLGTDCIASHNLISTLLFLVASFSRTSYCPTTCSAILATSRSLYDIDPPTRTPAWTLISSMTLSGSNPPDHCMLAPRHDNNIDIELLPSKKRIDLHVSLEKTYD